MNEKKSFGLANIALVATTFLWGLNAVITKNAVGDTPETFRIFVFNGLRIPAGSLLLFLTVKLSGGRIGIKKEHFPLIAAVSFFGMFLFMAGFISGIKLTSAANAGIIGSTIPFFILLVSFLSRIERPTKRTVTGILVGFCGVLALTVEKGGFSLNPGDVLIVLSCICWAIYTVFGKKILNVYVPMIATAWVYLLTSLYQLPLFLYQLSDQTWTTISGWNWFNLVISTVGSIYLANSLYYYSINKIGPSRVGVYTNLTPVFTILLAVMIRGEKITTLQITGLVVIIIGIVISRSKSKNLRIQDKEKI
ncbi:MAG: DMT family transporter [Candidatus Latescibacteria bacterium]|jgi:drug/metabolite transporter (DMT)-like permease|nr:DMT family transporter [Candidatus Latescibacterota bacterium]